VSEASRWLLSAFVAANVVACGGSDHGSTFGTQGSTGGTSFGGAANGGVTNGGTSGSTGGASFGGASGGGVSGSTGGGSGSAGTGGDGNKVCVGRGEVLPGGACYIGCEYNGADPPRYDTTGACSSFGWKCSPLAYCNPYIHCQVDASCQQIGGPAWLCVPTPTGPLVGECAIRCTTDADCPQNTPTPSPFHCKPVDNGMGTVVNICRF